MKKFLAVLLLLSLPLSARGQGVTILRSPSALANVRTRANASGKKVILGFTTGTIPADNVSATNATIAESGHPDDGTSGFRYRGLRDPAYIPGGFIAVKKTSFPIVIGLTPATGANGSPATPVQLFGGRVETGGGYFFGVQRNSQFTTLGNATCLFATGNETSGNPMVQYVGCGWYIGPMELRGADIANSGNFSGRDSLDKWPVGFEVSEPSSPTASFPEGSLFQGGLSLWCFTKGINIGSGSHCDNLTWGFLQADSCTTMYYCDNIQSLGHFVDYVRIDQNVGTAFHFHRGGGLHVKDMKVLGTGATILKVGAYDQNFYDYRFDNIKMDNAVQAVTLINFTETAASRGDVSIRMVGAIQKDVDFDPEDLIVGEVRATDKIYIYFTGPSAKVAELNALSTVDADGNYLP